MAAQLERRLAELRDVFPGRSDSELTALISKAAAPAQLSSDTDAADGSASWCKTHLSFLDDTTAETMTRARRVRMPVELRPWLYLGDATAATDRELLRRLGITHVVSCVDGAQGVKTGASFYGDDMKFLGFPSDDADHYPILSRHYDAVKAFVGAPRAVKVLVFCEAGVNRSTAIAVALMVDIERIRLCPALLDVWEKRVVILTNRGFRRQLVEFAKERHLLLEPKQDDDG